MRRGDVTREDAAVGGGAAERRWTAAAGYCKATSTQNWKTPYHQTKKDISSRETSMQLSDFKWPLTIQLSELWKCHVQDATASHVFYQTGDAQIHWDVSVHISVKQYVQSHLIHPCNIVHQVEMKPSTRLHSWRRFTTLIWRASSVQRLQFIFDICFALLNTRWVRFTLSGKNQVEARMTWKKNTSFTFTLLCLFFDGDVRRTRAHSFVI